jgi:hypothetical protein
MNDIDINSIAYYSLLIKGGGERAATEITKSIEFILPFLRKQFNLNWFISVEF